MLPKPKSYKFGHLPLLRCLAPSLHKLHESELLNINLTKFFKVKAY
jgi:hypothetical protein